ncbi:hypothetical protein [Streptomyces lichenis]|uniref:Molecular chaperone DnaJ n=1 Tax=Streptomyces lichenis TaxID=2306967 RepID=A0ABT0I508_9ACTN|nr:hypothetical protein [Streptomyces lichenis]MCK8676398.1 hypothetical protein [Streptomyces lichenis]
MAQHSLARSRVCGDCDGFPVVHITTGTATPDGQRRTVSATCPTCHGTGHRPATPRTSVEVTV